MTAGTTPPQKTVAVIGASNDRRKFSNKSVRAHAAKGWTVFPINPKETEVEGLTAYPSIRDIPLERVDRVTMYVLPMIGIHLLDDIHSKQPSEVWLNPGTESDSLVERAEQLGLPIIQACSIIDLGTTPSAYGA